MSSAWVIWSIRVDVLCRYIGFVGLSARAIDRNKKRARLGGQDRMAGLEEQ